MDRQLLEEVVENRVALWLADPAGKAALGLSQWPGRLEFIPGHLITSRSGRQLTDGILVTRIKDKTYRIVAVFEAKSGDDAAQGLSRSRVSFSRMSKADKAELRAEAEEALAVLERRTRKPEQMARMNSQISVSDLESAYDRLHPLIRKWICVVRSVAPRRINARIWCHFVPASGV